MRHSPVVYRTVSRVVSDTGFAYTTGSGEEPKELLFQEESLARKIAEHIGAATDVDVETIKQS